MRWSTICEALLSGGQLYLEYQPQQDRNGSLMGYEALVRWRHPVRGVIPPGDFIPIAEQSGTIAQIDDWVLTEACLEAASWDQPLRVAVNVSAAQFRRENLDRQVRQGHGLGVPVLAEVIETNAQMALLVQEGCDEMQGYLIGRPRSLLPTRQMRNASSQAHRRAAAAE